MSSCTRSASSEPSPPNFHRAWEDLCEKGLIGELERDGRLVKTRMVESPLREQFTAEHPGFAHFLEHDRIALITYPYEWSFSMLADAAILTLDIQMALLGAGYSLKDASAYNVQFLNSRPIFIDVTSLERPRRLDIWFALGQFQRMFLFPLLLAGRCGWDFKSYFLANLDGRTPEPSPAAVSRSRLMAPGAPDGFSFALAFRTAREIKGHQRSHRGGPRQSVQ